MIAPCHQPSGIEPASRFKDFYRACKTDPMRNVVVAEGEGSPMGVSIVLAADEDQL